MPEHEPDAVAEAFLYALDPELRPRYADADVGAELRAGWDRAAQAPGHFGLSLEGFARHVARRMDACATAESLRSLHFADLVLAWACLQRVHAALRTFDNTYAAVIEQVRRAANLDLAAAEFRQRVFQRVFVSEDEGPPRIATYRGTGTLKAWVRMVASRLATDDRRRVEAPLVSFDEALLGGDAKAELDVLDAAYGSSFREAFRQAVTALDPEERTILRLRYLHGLSVTELAKLRGMHRVTMSRLLTSLRRNVLERIVQTMGRRDALPVAEVESVLRLVRSRLDLSLSAFEY